MALTKFDKTLITAAANVAYIWPEWKRNLYDPLKTRNWTKEELRVVKKVIKNALLHSENEVIRLKTLLMELGK